MVISTIGPNVTVQANETIIPTGSQAAILCTIDSPHLFIEILLYVDIAYISSMHKGI
jgi:hypothetical protein